MDNKIIAGLVAIVIVLCGAWYFYSGQEKGSGQVTVATTTPSVGTSTQQTTLPIPVTHGTNNVGTTAAPPAAEPVIPPKVMGVNTLAYLLGLKEALVCSVKTTSGTKRSGMLYIAEGETRADLTTSTSAGTINTTMIDDGSYLYVWTNGATKGLKLLAAPSGNGSAIATRGGFDPEANISFACNPWGEKTGLFTPPSSIVFSNTY
ncbi:MAG: hypothetical protein WAN50_05115 [Minisyncoccia bacterium]